MTQLNAIAILENGLPATRVAISFAKPRLGKKARSLPASPVDSSGTFTIETDSAAGLIAKVMVKDKEFVISPIDTGADGTLVFAIPTDAAPTLESEFRRVTDAVTAEVSVDIRKLSEQGDRQDLTLLHKATDWDTRVLALRVLADRATTEATTAGNILGIEPEAAYGALRAGLPTDPAALAAVHPETFALALDAASKASVITLDVTEQAAAVAEFKAFRIKELSATKPGGGASTVEQLIAVAPKGRVLGVVNGVERTELHVFQDLIFEKWDLGTQSDLWGKATEKGISAKTVEELKIHGYLAFLTLNNAPLIERVRGKFSDLAHFADDLVDNMYDKRETWIADLGDNPSLPESFTTAEDPTHAYAGEIVRRVVVTFPTRVIAALVERGEVTPDEDPTINAEITALLKVAAAAGFRLGEQNPLDFLREHEDIDAAEDVRPQVHEALSTLHRLYQITPSNEMLALLSTHGIRSAQEVAQFSADEFLTVMSKRTSSRAEVELVHKRAVEISSYVYTFFSMARQSLNSPAGIRTAVASDNLRSRATASMSKALPSLEGLFGSMDYCECEHCRSVLSPAAYLVDILKFLDIDEKVWEGFTGDWSKRHNGQKYPFKKPFEELAERRPDIVNLQLSCENTTTELPTIDLVNEILEYRLFIDADDKNKTPDGGVHDSGATLSADVLAEPEFVRDEVYSKVLIDARYPHVLPFDLWYATASEFAHWLGLQLWRLQCIFSTPAADRTDPASLIGCGPIEYGLLTDPDSAEVHVRYGYLTVEEMTEQLTAETENHTVYAQTLARRLQISYVDLAQLLESRFVNPGLDALGWVLTAGISVASAREWRRDQQLANNPQPKNRDEVPLWRRLMACKARLAAIDAAHGLAEGTADNELRGLPDAAFESVVLLHNTGATNDFSNTTLGTGSGAGLPTDALGELLLRMDIFVRLQRRLGWSIAEVDALLAAGADQPDLTTENLEAGLRRVATVLELQALLPDAKRADLVVLVCGVNTLGIDPSYRRLFLSRPLPHRDPAFDAPFGDYLTLDDDGNPLKVGDHLTGLQSSLGLTHAEIAAVTTAFDTANLEPTDWASRTLSVDIVSFLLRHAILRRVLKVDITDLVTLKQLSGLSNDDLPALVRLVQQCQSAGLSVKEVESLVATGTGEPDGTDVRPDVPAVVVDACQAVRDAAPNEADGLRWEARSTITDAGGASAALVSLLLVDGTWPREGDSLFDRYVPADPQQDAVASVRQAHTLLAKTIFLATRLGLTDAEVRTLEVATILDVRDDPSDAVAAREQLRKRFTRLRDVLTYCSLRRSVASGSAELIAVLGAPADGTPSFAERLASVSGRTVEEVSAAANVLGVTGDPPVTVSDLDRVCDVMTMAANVGVAPATLQSWSEALSSSANGDPAHRQRVAREIKDAARAHLGARWNQVATPISDRLRQQQRDALVALCLHKSGIETVEQLFEDILLDPGSEPVLRTSRIRQAISAVQLFVQRVLLNLEPDVHASSIKASQWEWMKRYRMWEANRKIFLFPENWLEPEFRDDKSHLFAELESTLLQSDVTNDVVEDALLAYLQQLDEIARLDVVAMYCEQDYLDPSLNTLHVVGRTFASPQRYFYRRMATGVWTAWEPVDLDITGDNVVLAHWRDRLYLFWVTHFVKREEPKPASGAPAAGAKKLVDTNLNELRTATGGSPGTELQVQLHWSEYVNGGWSPTSTSGFIPAAALGAGQRIEFSTHSVVTREDTVQIHLNGLPTMKFELRGRNSPVEDNAKAAPQPPRPYTSSRTNALGVTYAPILTSVNGGSSSGVAIPTTALTVAVGRPSLVHPSNVIDLGGPDIGPLVSPFFFKDAVRTFFVQPTLREDTIEESVESWTIVESSPPPPPETDGTLPWFSLVITPQLPLSTYTPEVQKVITALRPEIDQIINPRTVVALDERLIGPVGTLSARDFRAAQPAAHLQIAADTINEIQVVAAGQSGLGSPVVAESLLSAAEQLQLKGVMVVEQSAIANVGLISGAAIVVQGKGGVFDNQLLSRFRPIDR